MRGTSSTSATVLTEKVVCNGVRLNRLFRITKAGASRFRVITIRVNPCADSSLTSAMPSNSRASTRSRILDMIRLGLAWYGNSVTTIRLDRGPSSMSVRARIRTCPRPVR